jgi:Ca2+-binding EF-hand superfamily protein
VQQGMGRNMPTFESFDLNSDGHLTENEMKEAREKRVEEKKAEGKMLRNSKDYCEFSKVDSDGDGKVTKDEFKSYQLKRRVK